MILVILYTYDMMSVNIGKENLLIKYTFVLHVNTNEERNCWEELCRVARLECKCRLCYFNDKEELHALYKEAED